MRFTLPLLVLAASPAFAEVPVVVTDIAPVHSLVAQVMGDLGTPALIVTPGTSFHDAGLRPSDAGALSGADLVIWSGEAAVPFLAAPIKTLAAGARVVTLLDAPGWERLPLRGAHGHESHDHGDGDIDPHAWLDPAVAAAWVQVVADALIQADPEHAGSYRANAGDAIDDLARLQDSIGATLAPVAGQEWLVAHDAYQYFERAFGISAAGTIALSDAHAPGPAHLGALRGLIAEGDVTCIITEPETSPDLIALLAGAGDVRVVQADPDGVGLAPGPDLYVTLVTGIAEALVECLE